MIGTDGAPASTIAPLETVNILLYAKVPNGLADTFEEAESVFTFVGRVLAGGQQG